MKLHIVMPVVNCLEFTKGAINSIRSATDYNIILIDNGSVDNTPQWAQEEAQNRYVLRNTLQYVRNEPGKGVAASWNQGVKIALDDPECEYIAILNNDIVLHPKTLDHLMVFMRKTRYLLVTGDNIKDRMSIDVMKQMELPEPFTDFDCNEITDWRAEGPDFSCYMINPETIKYIGWFDENFIGAYCEDQDYHVRIERARRFKKEFGHPPELDLNRIHAKRLTTAPYYHYASQTIKSNIPLRNPISINHGKNHDYYVRKWGAEHSLAMDGAGNMQPFGDATKNYKDW